LRVLTDFSLDGYRFLNPGDVVESEEVEDETGRKRAKRVVVGRGGATGRAMRPRKNGSE